MKILFLITKNDTGGAQKYVRDLVASLPREKFQTEIVTGGKGGLRFLSNAFRPYFLFLNEIVAVVEIAFLLRKKQPDILHLNSSKAGVIGALAAKLHNITCYLSLVKCSTIRVVFTAHGWVFNPHTYSGAGCLKPSTIGVGVNPQNALSPSRQKFYILLHRFAAHFQDAIINVSEYDRQLALHYRIAPAKKLFTIHNGIDADAIKFLDKEEARATLLRRLPPTTYNRQPRHWIGSVGRLVSEKNFATLIDAIALLKSQKPIVNCQLFIIGAGYERPMLGKKIADLGLQDTVFFLGALPDASQYLKAFDMFVMPSIKEGLPYTLIEAMDAGLPVVATKTGGMPEILEPDKGVIVPPRDVQALADAIRKLLADASLSKTFAANAQNYAKQELTLDRMVGGTIKVYERASG